MSRTGKLPIELGSDIKVSVEGATVSVKGPKGALTQDLPAGITASVDGQQLTVRRKDDSKDQKSLHGLARALLANAVHGVNQGFSKNLEIHGVGYRVEKAGDKLKFSLGFSHPIEFAVPKDVEVAIERNTRMTVSGCDRQKVGQVAANIRALRPPDVYKQKGIRYADEALRKKAGKTGVQ
jgi:large subunit ribosomal protein L6